jgi:branched-chain amino acid transport system permease protein
MSRTTPERRWRAGWGLPLAVEAGGPARRWGRVAVLALLALVALGFPFYNPPVVNNQFTLVMVYAVAVLGLNLIIGYAGQISLGHGAFFAVGAYTAAILITRWDVPYLLTVPAAGLVTFALGYAFGVPALRLHGLYLALVTLALAVAVGPLIRRMEDVTNGSQGMSVPQPSVPGWLAVDPDQYRYLLALLVTAVMFGLAVNLTRGGLGRALLAIRDNERAAVTMGTDSARVKTRAFAWSAAFAGVGGALFTFALGFVAPESFTLTLSFTFLTGSVIGGLGTVAGALVGALFVQFAPQVAEDVHQALTGVIFGVILILVMYVAPGGAVGLIQRWWRRVVVVVEPAQNLREGGPNGGMAQPDGVEEAPARAGGAGTGRGGMWSRRRR